MAKLIRPLLQPRKPSPQAAAEVFARAQAHHAQGRWAQAQPLYEQLIQDFPSQPEAHLCLGNLFADMRQPAKALACYDRVIGIAPQSAAAYFNRANALKSMRRFEEAVADFRKAIALQPDYAQAYNNLGNAFDSLGGPNDALECYDRALPLLPQSAVIHANRAASLKELRRLDEALASFETAFALGPNQEFLLGNLLSVKMQLCDWAMLPEALHAYRMLIQGGKRVALPFQALTLTDDPALNKQASQIYTQAKHPARAIDLPLPKPAAGAKIRLGYYSSEFRNHAAAYLMTELFELHDRSRFEVIAFSFGPDVQDEMRQRLRKGFDQFHDVDRLSDIDVVRLSRQMGIDIAIDLKGYTQDARPDLFAYRCAPVQVSYMGFPGTLGSDYIDYLIADHTVIAPEDHIHYTEKVVCMPQSYQVNDSKRWISERQFTRDELRLPADAFVFCCFNNSHKIMPATFESWIRILKSVPGSVLWLLDENPTATKNLSSEAQALGLAPERLVFAPRIALTDYLARYRAADLFLDTLPYNAHTTASDALWAGLPVLTNMGRTFAARVAASLLRALDLPELITESSAAFEAAAIALARDSKTLAKIRAKLAQQRSSSSLFDAEIFARHLEDAYAVMQARHIAGLPPTSFDVPMRPKALPAAGG